MPGTCTEPGCGRPTKGRGLCHKHHARLRFAENPERIRANNNRWRKNNRDKVLACNKAWLDAHPGKSQEYGHRNYLKRKYGITPEEKVARLARQSGMCANPGCGRTHPGGKGAWHTDHNHDTGQLRGELCQGCNTSLGQLGESADRIRGLAKYIQHWAKKAK